MIQDVVLVDIMQDIVNAMKVPDLTSTSNPKSNLAINFEPGSQFQIIKELNDLDNSISFKSKKYPLIAMVMPVPESRGSAYITVKIGRIVIAQICEDPDGTQDVLTRYKAGGTFKDILYPCYNEFLNQIVRNSNVVGQEVNNLVHTKLDNPGARRINSESTDFIDSIEILNLEFILTQIKTC